MEAPCRLPLTRRAEAPAAVQTTPTRPTEIPALTGLRALLAWWVVFYHVADPDFAEIRLGLLDPLRAHGYLAVDGFFILSGFILAYVYRVRFANPAPGTYFRFLVARLSRVYPVHIVVLSVIVVLIGSAWLAGFRPRVPERFALDELALQITLLHAWGFSRRLAWNYPSWSISAEWFAYLCFPLVHRLVLRSVSRAWPVVVALASLAGLLLLEKLGPNKNLSYTYEFALVRIGCEFTAGAALLMLARPWLEAAPTAGKRLRPHATLALLGAFVAIFVAPDAIAVAGLGLVILFLSHPKDALGALLSRPGALYAGETSYAVYMVHALIEGIGILALRAVPGLGAIPAVVRFLGLVVVVQLVADQAWRRIEKPGRDSGRRLGEVVLARFSPAPGPAA